MRILCRSLALVASLLLAVPGLGAADGPERFYAEDISAAGWTGGYRLEDVNGRVRTPEDFRGAGVLLYFGFTYCPDLCPTALLRLVEIKRRLGVDAAKIRVLFVTLDPERDSTAVMREYAPSFDADFVGLRGSDEATREAARGFKVFFQKVKGSAPDRYTIDHSDFIYVVDAAMRPRLRVHALLPIDQIVEDVRKLIGSP